MEPMEYSQKFKICQPVTPGKLNQVPIGPGLYVWRLYCTVKTVKLCTIHMAIHFKTLCSSFNLYFANFINKTIKLFATYLSVSRSLTLCRLHIWYIYGKVTTREPICPILLPQTFSLAIKILHTLTLYKQFNKNQEVTNLADRGKGLWWGKGRALCNVGYVLVCVWEDLETLRAQWLPGWLI